MLAKDILKELIFTDNECLFIYIKIISLFELSYPDDNAYNLYDNRIQNYCRKKKFKIIPQKKVNDVVSIYKDNMNLLSEDILGFFVFSHNSRNQLRQLIHHMRNAFSHANVNIITYKNKEYFKIQTKGTKPDQIKLFGIFPRENFQEFWDILLKTIDFKKK